MKDTLDTRSRGKDQEEGQKMGISTFTVFKDETKVSEGRDMMYT